MPIIRITKQSFMCVVDKRPQLLHVVRVFKGLYTCIEICISQYVCDKRLVCLVQNPEYHTSNKRSSNRDACSINVDFLTVILQTTQRVMPQQ